MLDVLPAVILAAGFSSRMGRTKALLPASDGETFIARIVRAFAASLVDDVVVVVGHQWEPIAEAIGRDNLPARVVVNERYADGQLSSVLTGLDAIDRPGVEAMALTLVDVPLITTAAIDAVVARFRATAAPIVRPVHGSLHGHPVVIGRVLFDDLRRADPAAGIKPIVRSHVSVAGDVEIADAGVYADVDTPERYRELFGRSI